MTTSDTADTPGLAKGETFGTRVTDAIIDMIGQGTLVPGQRLVEPVIARQLGVGTVPVREALRILAGDGVIELIPNRGARLRIMNAREVNDTLKGVAALLLAALDALEGRALDDLTARLEAICHRIAETTAADDGRALLIAVADYQREIVIAADNSYISLIIGRVHFAYFIGQVLQFVDVAKLSGAASRYPAITDALRQGDIARAKALIVQNRQTVSDYLEQQQV